MLTGVRTLGTRLRRTVSAAQSMDYIYQSDMLAGHAPAEDENVGITDTLAPVAAARVKATADQGPAARPDLEHMSSSHPQAPSQPQPLPGTHGEQIPARYTRKPPSTPIMLPEYRYCHREGFLKPMRAHHCRACGTVRATLSLFTLDNIHWGCYSVYSNTITTVHG